MENWDPKVRNQFKKKLRDLRFEGTVQNSYTKQLIANREAKAKAKEQQQEEVVFFSFQKIMSSLIIAPFFRKPKLRRRRDRPRSWGKQSHKSRRRRWGMEPCPCSL